MPKNSSDPFFTDQPIVFYNGAFLDPQTGLYLMGLRWYDSVVAVWASQDPISFGGGQTNLSEFCGDSPTNFVDPSGMSYIYSSGAASVLGPTTALSDNNSGLVLSDMNSGRMFTETPTGTYLNSNSLPDSSVETPWPNSEFPTNYVEPAPIEEPPHWVYAPPTALELASSREQFTSLGYNLFDDEYNPGFNYVGAGLFSFLWEANEMLNRLIGPDEHPNPQGETKIEHFSRSVADTGGIFLLSKAVGDVTGGDGDGGGGSGVPVETPANEGGITKEGIAQVEQHLSQFGPDGPNEAMIARLKAGETTAHDLNFYQHELYESELMQQGMEARAAHLQTLEWQGIPYEPGYESQLYHPDVIRQFPENFNPAAHP